jgi:hypothetical protein
MPAFIIAVAWSFIAALYAPPSDMDNIAGREAVFNTYCMADKTSEYDPLP